MTGGNYSIASHAYGRYRTEFAAYFLLITGPAYASCSLPSSVSQSCTEAAYAHAHAHTNKRRMTLQGNIRSQPIPVTAPVDRSDMHSPPQLVRPLLSWRLPATIAIAWTEKTASAPVHGSCQISRHVRNHRPGGA
jgi:hypothetical protein